jgi:arylsulfatase
MQQSKFSTARHSIITDVEIPAGGAEEILLSRGGIDGGFSFYFKD